MQKIFEKMKIRITNWSSNSVETLKITPKEESSPYEKICTTDITFGEP